jgi:ACR3 family arsenite efflux pump ArsB
MDPRSSLAFGASSFFELALAAANGLFGLKSAQA